MAQWRRAGELGTVGTFSFFPSKNLGGFGDGGMMVTQDDALAERLRKLRLHGGARQYHHEEVGYNSRLDTLQAAVLLAKFPHLEAWSRARGERARYYTEAFGGHADVCPPAVDPANEHIFHQYTIRVPRRERAAGPSQGGRESVTRSTTRFRCTCSRASPTWATAGAGCRRPRPPWTR